MQSCKMEIKNAKYLKDVYSSSNKNTGIEATIDDTVCSIPLDPNNRHYAEILKQVEEGKLTIKDAD